MGTSLLAPIINAGSSLIGSIYNTASQNRQNRLAENFSREMYGRQRADALSDTAMQNQYNSPAANMERLKAAGLNPNLVYGSGGATQQAAPVRSSSVESVNRTAPQIDLSSVGKGLMDMYDIKVKNAQADQLAELTKVAQQEQILKAMQTNALASQTEQTKVATSKMLVDKSAAELGLRLATDTYDTKVKQQAADLKQTGVNTQYTLDQNERAKLINSQTLAQGVQQIAQNRFQLESMNPQELLKRKAEIQSIEITNSLNNLEKALNEMGISKTDPYYIKMAARAANYLREEDKKENTAKKINEMSGTLLQGINIKSHKKH